MKMLKGLFVLGLIVTGLILSQAGRAQEEGAIIDPERTQLYVNLRTGDTFCAGEKADASPILEATGVGCDLIGPQ